MEVPRTKVTESFSERPAHLYGIAGWFVNPPHAPGDTANIPIAFGGYFKHCLDGPALLTLDGKMVDIRGPSLIKGKMNEEELVFTKIYWTEFGRSSVKKPYIYRFKKEDHLWVGTYEIPEDEEFGKHYTQATTTLVEEDAYPILYR